MNNFLKPLKSNLIKHATMSYAHFFVWLSMNQTTKQVIKANKDENLDSGICTKKKNIKAEIFEILLIYALKNRSEIY